MLNLVAASRPILQTDITPKSADVAVGGELTFATVFAGTLPIFYQWQANTGHGLSDIPDATNASLTLTNLQTSNSGEYQIVASNSIGGPVTSSTASLTVSSVPAFPQAVLAANPVGYWRLNETGKTSGGTLVAVDAMQKHNGTYGSASTDNIPGPAPAGGLPGFETNNTAVEFTNGLPNSFVTLPALNLNANTVTITAWVYPKGTPAAYSGIVFCRNPNDASGFNFTDNGQIGYTWNQNNEDSWAWMSGLVPPSDQWSFIALVVSPNSAVAYLCNNSGQFSATNAIAHTAEAFTSDTLIGGDNDDGGNGETSTGSWMKWRSLTSR